MVRKGLPTVVSLGDIRTKRCHPSVVFESNPTTIVVSRIEFGIVVSKARALAPNGGVPTADTRVCNTITRMASIRFDTAATTRPVLHK
jgi:hypothetical protein